MTLVWKTSRHDIVLDRPLVMGILNVTPDSFSDGGDFLLPDAALRRAEQMIAEGADILDVGGESTRPGSVQRSVEEEAAGVIPVIASIAKRFDKPISVDTTKAFVAERALASGAEIINDISGLRFDVQIAEVAAKNGAGLVLMHSRGDFASLHSQPPVEDIFSEVIAGLRSSLAAAEKAGVSPDRIALDIGLGFGKTFEQNLELLANLDRIAREFEAFPMLVGASRKSFIGKVLGNAPVNERLSGSVAAAVWAISKGAHIVRVHDVAATVAAIRVTSAASHHLID